jgi:hypothetical protein
VSFGLSGVVVFAESVTVVLVVLVALAPVALEWLGVVVGSGVQPKATLKPNSIAAINIFFIFPPQVQNVSYFAGTFPSLCLRYRSLGFYSRVSYNLV